MASETTATGIVAIPEPTSDGSLWGFSRPQRIAFIVLLVFLGVAPFAGLYPVFLMKLLCFGLFACAFNLLIGYVGLLS
ncbi:MAG: branched-chain amino acid transporter permease, partial [Rhodospirillales bacterium]|nr:branched-chain amino acid transporter permease [Rhodospirillales bacterium]